MNEIDFDTRECSPWADINLCLNNMRSLTVKAGGATYEGRAKLIEEDGHVTLELESKKRGRKPKE